MTLYQWLLPLALIIQLTACSSSNDAESLPTEGDDETPPTPPTLPTPEYRGELTFTTTLDVDLGPMISEAGLNRVDSYQVSRNGTTIRADVLNDNSDVEAIIIVDTETGDASWLASDIGENTLLLFDAQNTPVAVMGIACESVVYTPSFSDTLTDLSSLSPEGQCVYQNPILSADGNVLLFETYDPQDLSQFGVPNSTTLHAYTLDSASLQTYPDTRIEVDGVTLSPRLSAISYQGYTLSDNGQLLFSQQWWEGTDADGSTLRQVGATLWNTLNDEWVVRGQEADLRGCTITSQIDCKPPYSYTLSADGSSQYTEIPVGVMLENRPPYDNFASAVEFYLTNSPTATPVAGTGSSSTLVTNNDGDQLIFYAGADSENLEQGYTLYQRSSNTYHSLSRALRACALTDENGIDVEESDCEYTSVPGALSSKAENYTADGQHVQLRSISRRTDASVQTVDNFLFDVQEGAVYSLPVDVGWRAEWVSGDASIVMGVGNALFIGKR